MLFSFPKETVHYRWTLEDVETVLVKLKTKVKSPEFNIPGDDSKFYFIISLTGPSYNDSYDCSFQVCHAEGKKSPANIWVMNSSFSLLNLLTGDAVTSTKAEFRFKDMSFSKSYKSSIFKSCLNDRSLTFEVTFTALLLDHPVQCAIQTPPVVCVSEKIRQVYEKKRFTDMKIVVQGKTFNVHRAVLAAQSQVFEKMFENNMKEKLERKIEIFDLDSNVVEDLIAFLYSGRITNLKSCHKQLFIAADKYNIQDLMKLCLTEIKKGVTLSNVVESLSLARMIPSEMSKSLKECCLSFLKRNKATIYKSKEWEQFKESSPEFVFEIMEELTF